MKKSRIFLAVILALGIAGAVVAKARTHSVYYNYIVFPDTPMCVEGIFDTDPCPFGIDSLCTTSVGGTTVQLFTALSSCTAVDVVKRAQ